MRSKLMRVLVSSTLYLSAPDAARAVSVQSDSVLAAGVQSYVAAPVSQGRTIDLLPKPNHENFYGEASGRRLQPRYLGLAVTAGSQATAAKLRKLEVLNESNDLDGKTDADITNAAMAADPILSRVSAKYQRYDQWYLEAERKDDLSALASIDRGETAALHLHAQLTGRLQQGEIQQTLVQV